MSSSDSKTCANAFDYFERKLPMSTSRTRGNPGTLNKKKYQNMEGNIKKPLIGGLIIFRPVMKEANMF